MFKKIISVLVAASMTATIASSAAFAANGDVVSARENDADIRVAVFGDSHVTAFPVANEDWTHPDKLNNILGLFQTIDPEIDAFAMPGDVIFNVGPESEKTPDDEQKYEAVLNKIGEYFAIEESDEAPKTTEVIWSMGNHEITQGAYKGADVKFDNETWEKEVADNKARYTAALGHEPCYKAVVNGYTFVTAEPYDYLNNYVDPADKTKISAAEQKAKTYLEEALAADETKPVFYLQHEAIDKTFFGSASTVPTRNSEEFREFILSNPRIITISGHSHFPSQDPRCIYQTEGGSTHINIPVTIGGNMAGYGAHDEDNFSKNSSHGMVIEASGNEVTVLRFDAESGKYIGEPYVFTAGTANACYTDARYAAAKNSEENVPYFEGEASVSEITNNTAKLNFPVAKKDGESAEGLQDSFVHFYNVALTNTKTGKVVQTKKLLNDFWRQEDVQRTSRNVYFENLSRNTTYEVSIVAASSLGQESAPLTTSFTTTNEKTAEDLALTKRIENKNVALGKTVTLTTDQTTAATLVDGKATTPFEKTINSGEGVVLDLGRRYNINEIVLNSYNGGGAERGFVLYGSNDPTFPENNRTKLYEFGVSQNTNPDFDDNNNLSVVPTTESNFRYLKYERTIDGWYIYLGEISVYADEYETEVSRNVETYASHTYSDNQPASKIVDGKNEKEADGWMSGWLSEGNNAYIYLDLGTALPISRIEMEGLFDSGNATAHSRGYWNIYGSTTMNTADLVTTDGAWGNLAKITNENYTELATTGVGKYIPLISDASHRENTYKLNEISDSTNKELVGIVNEFVSGNYRYITFHHGINNLAALGEVRVYVTNPTLNSAQAKDDGIVLSFSDVMDANTLNSDSIKVYNADDELIDGIVVTPSADGYEAIISNVSNAAKVQVTYDIKSALGVEIAGKMEYYIAGATDLSGKPIITEENINVAQGKTITAENAELTTGSTSYAPIVDGNEATQTFMYSNKANGESNTNPSYITLDLENRYNIKKLDLLMYDNNLNNFAIYVSNDEDFKTYDTLIDYNGYGGDQFDENHRLVLELDGKYDYRYVRIHKKGYAWFGIKELAVYADTSLAEVSRGASVTVSHTYAAGFEGDNIVDGKNEKEADGWLSGWLSAGVNGYAYVDLGTTLPITRIEMEGLFASDNATAHSRGYWNVYGSTTMNEADLATTDGAWGALAKINNENYTQLATTGVGKYIPLIADASHRENTYKLNEISDSTAEIYGIVREAVSGDYRYITFHHGINNLAALGEVRVYSPAPTANSVRVDGDKVTVSFSDKMFPDSMNEDTIVLKNAETGEVIAQSNASAKGYEYTFEAGLDLNTEYVVEVADTVKNLNNLTVSETEIAFETPDKLELTGMRVDITNGKYVSKLAANTAYTVSGHVSSEIADQKTVTILAVEKTGERVVAVHSAEKTAYANTDSYFALKFTTGETVGENLEFYLLDGFGTMTPYGEKITY